MVAGRFALNRSSAECQSSPVACPDQLPHSIRILMSAAADDVCCFERTPRRHCRWSLPGPGTAAILGDSLWHVIRSGVVFLGGGRNMGLHAHRICQGCPCGFSGTLPKAYEIVRPVCSYYQGKSNQTLNKISGLFMQHCEHNGGKEMK